MNFSLVLVLAIIAHEYGHWIIPKHMGGNPRIKIGWITLGVEFDLKDWLPIRTLIDSRILGIITGYFVILLLGAPQDLIMLTFFYVALSAADILMIIILKVKAHRDRATIWSEMNW